jgi:hypothetical protein
MIGHMTRNSLKSDPGIMLDFFEAGGGCSSRNSGTINSYPSILPVPTPSLKYTKREFSELTPCEMLEKVREIHSNLGKYLIEARERAVKNISMVNGV